MSGRVLPLAALVVAVALIPLAVHSDYILTLCVTAGIYAIVVMGLGILLNDRGQSLVDAAYRAMGYRTNAGGAWTH